MSSTEKVKALRSRRLSEGLCSECGERPHRPNRHRCEQCTAEYSKKDRQRRKRKIASGVCHTRGCNQPLETAELCKQCHAKMLKKHNEMRRKFRSQNICVCCFANQTNGSVYCEKCHLKQLSTRYLGSVQYWPLLLDLLERQNRRCTYSGIPIELGKTASLDHIVAKSKGGKNTIENLQWVHIWINKMKNTMSNDEFVTALDEFSSQLAAYRTSKN